MDKQKLGEIAKNFQHKLEEIQQEPFGSCYLAGPCIADYIKSIGIPARDVTGTLLLIDKHGKYAVYGRNKYKGKIVGEYHTWCEVTIDGEIFIVDASLKYNKIFLRNHYKIKLHSNIPDILVTTDKESYYWKYMEEEALTPKSKKFLKDIHPSIVNKVSDLNLVQK